MNSVSVAVEYNNNEISIQINAGDQYSKAVASVTRVIVSDSEKMDLIDIAISEIDDVDIREKVKSFRSEIIEHFVKLIPPVGCFSDCGGEFKMKR